jgi:Flp pilus assembly secretin CpaC
MTGSHRASVLVFAAFGAAVLLAPSASAFETAKPEAGRPKHAAAVIAGPSMPMSDERDTVPTSAGRDTVAVMIDHAKVVRLPERTQTVIIGNPMIADLTVQKNGVVVVTGKSYGITNVIALDGAGALLAESLVRVQAATESSVVIVQRGLERESYSCTPNCQPSILLGDANKYFSEIGGQAGQRNTLATQR